MPTPARQATTSIRPVTRVVRGSPTSDGAGVKLTRLIGTQTLPDLDPFLMLDEFRSDEAADYLAGFPNHPHRGFETVTYMLAGRMRHGDNQGNVGLLRPGSVQWMTAGRGIIHSEMPEQENGLMWGFQLWVNLPGRDKMTAPRYQDIEPETIPVVELPHGVRVKVLAGKLGDTAGPARAASTDPTYLDVTLPAGTSFSHHLPDDHTAFAYVFEGAGGIADKRRAPRRACGARRRRYCSLRQRQRRHPRRLILVAGTPIREPVAKYGPFVMNTPAEIRQAIDDYNSGRF